MSLCHYCTPHTSFRASASTLLLTLASCSALVASLLVWVYGVHLPSCSVLRVHLPSLLSFSVHVLLTASIGNLVHPPYNTSSRDQHLVVIIPTSYILGYRCPCRREGETEFGFLSWRFMSNSDKQLQTMSAVRLFGRLDQLYVVPGRRGSLFLSGLATVSDTTRDVASCKQNHVAALRRLIRHTHMQMDREKVTV